MKKLACVLLGVVTVITGLLGCGGGGGGGSGGSSSSSSSNSSTSSFAIGGSINGLVGSGLVLQNNAGNDLSITADGAFAFSTLLASGSAYAVTVKTQPTVPAQNCTVINGTGTVGAAVVTNVAVNCVSLVAKYLYVPNRDSDSISAFSVDATTGALTALSVPTYPTADAPTSVRVEPSGKYLYAVNTGTFGLTAPSVSGYSINASAGSLTAMTDSPFAFVGSSINPMAVQSLLFHPSGKFGYTAVLEFTLARVFGKTINQSDGNLTDISGSPYTVDSGLPTSVQYGAFNSTGTKLYVPFGLGVLAGQTQGSIKTYDVNTTTGVLSAGGTILTGGTVPVSPIIDPSGKFLYVANLQSGSVSGFSIDATTGALSAVSGSPVATGNPVTGFLAVHRSGKYLYAVTQTAFATVGTVSVAAYGINSTTGALTPIGSPLPTTSNNAAGSFSIPIIDVTGKFLYFSCSGTSTIEAFAINQTTGALTAVSAPTPTASNPSVTILDPSGKYLFVAGRASNDVRSYSIGANGALTPVTVIATGTAPGGPALAGLQ